MPTTLRPLSRSLCRTRTRRRCTRSVCPTRKSTHQRTISPSTHVFLRLHRSSLYARTCVCALLVTKESRMTHFGVSCVFPDTPSRTDGRRYRRSRAPHCTGSAESCRIHRAAAASPRFLSRSSCSNTLIDLFQCHISHSL